MNERYIEINGNPTTMPLPADATWQDINDFIRDYLRYKGDFAGNLVPVENDRNTNEEPEESADEESY